MKQLGFKKVMLLSILLLVAISVSISSYVSYLQQKSILTTAIMDKGQSYVRGRGDVIKTMLNEKVGGITKLAKQFKNKPLMGSVVHSAADTIEQTKFLANAMNLNSAVIAFENGDGYWNLSTPTWMNHKYSGDVTTRPWYQAALRHKGVLVTDPYKGTDGKYWVSIIEKVDGGTISTDMELSFLDALVKPSANLPGSVAIIFNSDGLLLASSSQDVKSGQNALDFPWFKGAITKALDQQDAVVDYQVDGVDKILFSHRIKVGDKYWFYAVGVNRSIAFAELASARDTAILVALIATVVSIIIAFMLIQLLYRPIISLREMIAGLSSGNGDLTQRLKVNSNDDIGQISTGINTFIESLQQMMLEVKDASDYLQSNVVRLRKQAEQNKTILQKHLSETEQVATAVEQMDATANSMATDAANTAELTEQANQTSHDSRVIVNNSQQTMSALITDVQNASNDVQLMDNQTQNISSILNVIGAIAEQTNLLALNAAIEAARAGEQGRGFAVVADEVRSLASRTKDSTQEIENSIESLVQGCRQVVHSMNDTKARCEDATSGSDAVAESLDALTNFVNQINGLSTQIATAAEEQSGVTKEISRNMNEISSIVSELDSNGQKALNDAEDIERVNNQLIAIVSRFKV
ncbi:methyl-accepting chemotaxis protein [Celerinatantimonas diazotrophica]|uniref:Methyl-accepting chemotaxis protein n=1 Tax=Celerinatantimonas diazotrophica TaxID=412034 RepID=A0A4V2PNK8_9GAMM|nr:methyl-accepting chemotaxis protein [Celerinatantimonas diazotrophica]TCK47421.1 methyl-accepting chemotaxis protein [Celerinatantimonas diazotrophica]CAG9294961.1 Methyl-accepting chemotaxis protein McpG [Celerinatantimonas diazotrophica]